MNASEIAHQTNSSADIIDQLKLHLAQEDAKYPEDIIEQIIQQKEYTVPKLLDMLEQFITKPPRDSAPIGEWHEGVVALFVLAKLKEKKAFPLVIKLCSLPHKTAEDLLGDIVTEHLDQILASTFDGSWHELYIVVMNLYLYEYVRSAALKAYVILYRYGEMPRSELVVLFRNYLDDLVNDLSFVPSSLVSRCKDAHLVELYPQIKHYYDNDIVDDFYIPLEEVDRHFALSGSEAMAELQRDWHITYIEDLKDEMSWLFKSKNNK